MLELPKVAIHYIPPTSEVEAEESPSDSGKLDFPYFMRPLIELIMSGRGAFFSATQEIATYSQRMVNAARTVFYRLITPPSFDPTHASFKEILDRFEAEIPQLQRRVDQLEQRFWQSHLINRDLQELEKLNKEVSESLRHLDHYANVLEGRRRRFPVQDQLDRVRNAFHACDDQIDAYCMAEGKFIFEEYQKVIDLFTKGDIGLPNEIQRTLIQMWENLSAVFVKRVRNQLHTPEGRSIRSVMRDVSDQVKAIKKQSSEEVHSVQFAHPLKLKNKENNCYLNSTLQAFLCVAAIREELAQPLQRDMSKPLADYQKKIAIQQELLQFLATQPKHQGEQGKMSEMEFILYLLEGPSFYRLRDAIFRSDLHSEFNMANLKTQLDASSVAELLTEEFLPSCKFEYQALRTVPALAGLRFRGPEEKFSVLQIPLRAKEEYYKLNKLIHTSLGLHVEHNQRKFDTKKGEIIKGKEEDAALILDAGETDVDEYHEKFRFINKMPPILVLQFKRFVNLPSSSSRSGFIQKKVDLPVILPEDGILDLSQYYDAPVGESKKARYRIKSMVRHRGGLHGGHYVAAVEINGKYFHCDDLESKGYHEISKKEFYGHKDPYLLVLERIPTDDDKAEPTKAIVADKTVRLEKK